MRAPLVGARARAGSAAGWLVTSGLVALTLVAWELAVRTSDGRQAWLVSLADVATSIREDAPLLSEAALVTLKRLVPGFVVGSVLGVVGGLLVGTMRAADDVLDPVVSATYALPKIALFPVLAVMFGYTDQSRTMLVAIGCFYPAYASAVSGARGVDVQLVRLAANAGVGRVRTFLSVVVPSALPRVVVGLRIGLAVSYSAIFAAEALGGTTEGIGPRILFVLEGFSYDSMYAALVCFAVLGVLSDRLLLLIGRWLTQGQRLSTVVDA